MTRAEIVAGLKSIAEWQTDMAGEDDDGRELFLKDAEVVRAAAEMLEADGPKGRKVLMIGGKSMGKQAAQMVAAMSKVKQAAAKAERARIREALLKAVHKLISRLYVGDGFTSTQRLVTRDSVEAAIERICATTGTGGHEG